MKNLVNTPSFLKSSLIVNLITISIVFYLLGVSLPILTSTKLFIFKKDITLIKSILLLFDSGNIFLGILILTFTIIFPILKYIAMLWLQFSTNENSRMLISKILKNVGKWSMLDVFVIAMLILTFKLGKGWISLQLRLGTVFFAGSVITSIIATYLIYERKKKPGGVDAGVND